MNDWQIPPELESLEQELASRSAPQPTIEFRRRITTGVRVQLRRERVKESWRYAVAVALVVAVWINLSLSAARETDFHFKLADKRPSVEQTALQIQNLLPEISANDARREALVLCAGANLVICPKINIPPITINQVINPNGFLP